MNRRDAIKALTALPSVASIQVANLAPNDVVVIECDAAIPSQAAERIKEYVQTIWPEHKCIILGDGLHMKIVRQ